MLRFGRAVPIGLVGLAPALIALILADAPLRAEPESRAEGRIAFTFGESGADHPSQLAVMDADGKNRRVVGPDHIYGLSWSPDGRFIALYGGLNIFTLNVDGRPRYRRVVGNVGNGATVDWSPNGRSIAFDRGRDIWAVNLNDRRQRRLVRDGHFPSWSPDGKKLAFTRGPLGGVPDLWVLEIPGQKERRLVRNGDDANWSPDGRQIAFDRCQPQSQISECFIYVMRSDGTKQRRLFRGGEPVWSPNGQELAFIGRDDGRYDAVIRARLDGSGRRVLFGQKPYCGCGSLDWSPRAHGGRR